MEGGSMDINKVVELFAQAETDILNILLDLREKTGLSPHNLVLHTVDVSEAGCRRHKRYPCNVDLEVNLMDLEEDKDYVDK